MTSPSRSGTDFFFSSSLVLDELLKFFHAWQLAQIFQAKMNEEFLRCLIEDRPAEHVLAACGGNEFLVKKCLDHACCMDAPNLLDFRNSHRLFVRDNSECLERRQRQAR